MNDLINYKSKASDSLQQAYRNDGYATVVTMFRLIFPRPMDKAELLYDLVEYALSDEAISLSERPTVSGDNRLVQFIPDPVLARIDPDSKDTFLKLQRLRRKHFIQRLRRVEVNGVSGVRMSLNWKLLYERLTQEHEKILACQKAYQNSRKEEEGRAA